MTSSPTAHEAYAEALAAFRDSEDRVRNLADRVSHVAQALADDPLTLAPSHPMADGALPLHIMTHPFRRDLDLAGMPDGAEIVQALAGLHAARSRALALFAWLLPADREAAEAP